MESDKEITIIKFVNMNMKIPVLDVEYMDWKFHATSIALLVFGYSVFYTLKRTFHPQKRSVFITAHWPFHKSVAEASAAYITEAEICPICLELPQIGVQAGCGHRICAHCLLAYCRNYGGKRNKPPPCPLCRKPLDTVTMALDQINLSPRECNSNVVDSTTVQRIEIYKERCGQSTRCKPGLFVDKTRVLIKLLLASITIGIIARFQRESGIDLVMYNSFCVTIFGMILMTCLWFKCREQATLDAEY